MQEATISSTRLRAGRTRRGIVALSVALALSLGVSGCGIGWQLGTTHGLLVEVGAGRASLIIYREQSRVLWILFDATNSITIVRDTIWDQGGPPLVEACTDYDPPGPVGSRRICIGTSQLRGYLYDSMFGNVDDLRQAMYDTHGADDCLSFTFISFALPDSNWTHKSLGCHSGTSVVENPTTITDEIDEHPGDTPEPGN